MRNNEETTILVVNDLHCGSDVAVMPKKVRVGNGNVVHSNELQKFLFKKWKEMCNREEYDVCIVNGDTCDGINKHGDGEGCWTTDKSVQVETAVRLLKGIDAAEYYCTEGSKYHVGDPSLDELVSRGIGAVKYDTDLNMTIDNVRFHVRHKTPFTRIPSSRSHGIMNDMLQSILNRSEFGEIDVFLRAHTHYAHAVYHEGMTGIINPCWKGRDKFMRLNGMLGSDLGYTVIRIDESGVMTYEMNTFNIPAELTIDD